MNLNIALNTIIYIMVFLFPGVLFRKFYYIEGTKHQFSYGHLLERFLLTILLSTVCLGSFVLFDYTFTYLFKTSFVIDLNYNDFKNVFKSISKNEVPGLFEVKKTFISFVSTFFFIYLFSAFFGWISYHFVKIIHLDYFISVLRFNNEWDYLLTLPNRKIAQRRMFEKMNAQLDILTKCGDKETLFQGMYHKLIFNKDNEIDTIVLTNVTKFISIELTDENKKKLDDINDSIDKKEFIYHLYKTYKSKLIYKKYIQSHSFLISKKDIININLLYIKDKIQQSDKIKNVNLLFKILNVCKLLVLTSACSMLFIDFEINFLSTFWYKVYFLIITLFELFLTLHLIMYLIKVHYLKIMKKTGGAFLLISTMITLVPFYLNIFIDLSPLRTFVSFVSLVCMSIPIITKILNKE